MRADIQKEFLKGFNFFPDKQCVGGVWGASSKKENMSFIIYTHDSDFEGGEYLDLIQKLKNKLENEKILILGFGKEGTDNYLTLRKLFPEKN